MAKGNAGNTIKTYGLYDAYFKREARAVQPSYVEDWMGKLPQNKKGPMKPWKKIPSVQGYRA